MVIDSIVDISKYSKINSELSAVSKHLSRLVLGGIEPGRYDVDDSGSFFYCFEYKTKAASLCSGEVHSKMIDVHYIISGAERIGVCSRHNSILSDYDEANDYSRADAPFVYHTLSAGMFVLLLPHEAHVTGVVVGDSPVEVKKLVFKIPFGI